MNFKNTKGRVGLDKMTWPTIVSTLAYERKRITVVYDFSREERSQIIESH
ncbi:unnamed protein product [Musa textilis]